MTARVIYFLNAQNFETLVTETHSSSSQRLFATFWPTFSTWITFGLRLLRRRRKFQALLNELLTLLLRYAINSEEVAMGRLCATSLPRLAKATQPLFAALITTTVSHAIQVIYVPREHRPLAASPYRANSLKP